MYYLYGDGIPKSGKDHSVILLPIGFIGYTPVLSMLGIIPSLKIKIRIKL